MRRCRMVRFAGAAAAVVLLGVTAGCGGGEESGPEATAPVPSPTSTLPAAKGGPLTDLPECSAPPEPAEGAEAEVVLPDDTVVTGVEDLGELLSVRGYVALTPIQVREFYEAAPELQVYVAEDEVYEAEVLFGADDNRVYVKAQAQCRQGSLLSLFEGPEDGEGLPPLSGR
jgi:hypothetical protein